MPHAPVRMCVICRQRFTKAELARHVLSPEGELAPDSRRIMPGRGWYVCSLSDCGEKFQKRKTGMIRRKGGKK